jgi:enoyl-[acyl-carrier protein] reductase II
MRCRTNDYINDWESRPQDIKPFPFQAIHSTQTGVIGGIGGITDEAKLSIRTIPASPWASRPAVCMK